MAKNPFPLGKAAMAKRNARHRRIQLMTYAHAAMMFRVPADHFGLWRTCRARACKRARRCAAKPVLGRADVEWPVPPCIDFSNVETARAVMRECTLHRSWNPPPPSAPQLPPPADDAPRAANAHAAALPEDAGCESAETITCADGPSAYGPPASGPRVR
ncbi:hypothetical protein [Pararhizobium mangrovi]|uniref:Uncharacterized protein n=1 Tax=Pararhizobium mangrovi TaxID=2590452 RepID=A0A506UHQ0_9HYPH|nr:hypothetical protein [Pararhizobium mangrovi]TPW32829.1 hypothetical protein FJU11_00980 [Pararhizobium mangrovi]